VTAAKRRLGRPLVLVVTLDLSGQKDLVAGVHALRLLRARRPPHQKVSLRVREAVEVVRTRRVVPVRHHPRIHHRQDAGVLAADLPDVLALRELRPAALLLEVLEVRPRQGSEQVAVLHAHERSRRFLVELLQVPARTARTVPLLFGKHPDPVESIDGERFVRLVGIEVAWNLSAHRQTGPQDCLSGGRDSPLVRFRRSDVFVAITKMCHDCHDEEKDIHFLFSYVEPYVSVRHLLSELVGSRCLLLAQYLPVRYCYKSVFDALDRRSPLESDHRIRLAEIGTVSAHLPLNLSGTCRWIRALLRRARGNVLIANSHVGESIIPAALRAALLRVLFRLVTIDCGYSLGRRLRSECAGNAHSARSAHPQVSTSGARQSCHNCSQVAGYVPTSCISESLRFGADLSRHISANAYLRRRVSQAGSATCVPQTLRYATRGENCLFRLTSRPAPCGTDPLYGMPRGYFSNFFSSMIPQS
jgi:hypothetical protein